MVSYTYMWGNHTRTPGYKKGRDSMHPYWFFIGRFPIRSYSTLFLLAFLLGLGVTLYIARAEGKEEYTDKLSDMLFLAFFAGIVGSRAWQVFFFDWSFYKSNPGEILAVWHGGLSIQGGIVGAGLFCAWYCWKHKMPLWTIADLCAPGILLGQSIGRDANLMNGDAFGAPTGGNFGLLYPEGSLARDTFHDQPLWPAEVWEGQIDVILFALLLYISYCWGKKLPQGWRFVFYLVTYNGARFGLEMLRGDYATRYFHMTTGQWSAVAAIVVAIGLSVHLWRQHTARQATQDA